MPGEVDMVHYTVSAMRQTSCITVTLSDTLESRVVTLSSYLYGDSLILRSVSRMRIDSTAKGLKCSPAFKSY